MNRTVKVTSMSVQAKGEGGLLVSEANSAGSEGWDDEATFDVEGSEPIQLYPASTYDSAKWWHANSSTLDNAAGNQNATTKSTYLSGNYEDISDYEHSSIGTAVANSTAVGTVYYKDADLDKSYDNGEGYYIKYTYYLKTSGSSQLTLGTNVGEQCVQITVPSITGSGSADLDASLRVGVALDGYFYIFAPVTGYTGTYYVTTTTNGTSNIETKPTAGATAVTTQLTTLPAVTSEGTEADVYVWYEGEDANCKSSNLKATIDELEIEVDFTLTDLSEATTAGGTEITQ